MPGYVKFSKELKNHGYRYCSLTIDDGKMCLSVYGKEIAKLKGIKTRQNSSEIEKMIVSPLPLTLVETHS